MPDDLPPLDPEPQTAAPSPDFVGQLEHSADWARTFGGSDTNLAERARHNQDTAAYAAVLATQRQTAQANILQNSKAAQDLYFGTQRMTLQEQEAQQRMQHASELHPLQMQAKQAAIDADLARQTASVTSGLAQSAKAKALADQQAAADSDTLKFVNGEQDLATQFGRGTPQYQQGLLDLHASTPAGDQQFKAPYVSAAIKATSTPAQTDPAEIQPPPGTALDHVVVDSAGKSHAVFKPLADTDKQAATRLSHLESLRMKPNVDPDVKAYLDNEITKLKLPIPTTTSPGSVPPVPPVVPPTATAAPGGDGGEPQKYSDANSVKAAFKAGTISQDQAAAILRTQFGHR